MTLSEFKAWLEGYSASFAGEVPDADQWTAIKAKLASVEAFHPITPVPYYSTPLRIDTPTIPGWSTTCGQANTYGISATATN